MELILDRIERGEGREVDADLLARLSGNIGGNSLCALGDAAVGPSSRWSSASATRSTRHVRDRPLPVPARPPLDAVAAGAHA